MLPAKNQTVNLAPVIAPVIRKNIALPNNSKSVINVTLQYDVQNILNSIAKIKV